MDWTRRFETKDRTASLQWWSAERGAARPGCPRCSPNCRCRIQPICMQTTATFISALEFRTENLNKVTECKSGQVRRQLCKHIRTPKVPHHPRAKSPSPV